MAVHPWIIAMRAAGGQLPCTAGAAAATGAVGPGGMTKGGGDGTAGRPQSSISPPAEACVWLPQLQGERTPQVEAERTPHTPTPAASQDASSTYTPSASGQGYSTAAIGWGGGEPRRLFCVSLYLRAAVARRAISATREASAAVRCRPWPPSGRERFGWRAGSAAAYGRRLHDDDARCVIQTGGTAGVSPPRRWSYKMWRSTAEGGLL